MKDAVNHCINAVKIVKKLILYKTGREKNVNVKGAWRVMRDEWEPRRHGGTETHRVIPCPCVSVVQKPSSAGRSMPLEAVIQLP
jgi:hypothetical protein